ALLAGAIVLVVLLAAVVMSLDDDKSSYTTDVVTLTEDVRAGTVAKIVESSSGRSAMVEYTDAEKPAHRVSIPSGTSLPELFASAGIPVTSWPAIHVQGESALGFSSPIVRIFIVLAIVVGVLYFIRRSQAGFGRQSSRKGAFDP